MLEWQGEPIIIFGLSSIPCLPQNWEEDILANSSYKKGSWATGWNSLTERQLRQDLVFCYCKFHLYTLDNHKEEQNHLICQFAVWLRAHVKANKIPFMAFEDREYPPEWWMSHKRKLPQLSLALQY